ncbi:MAG: FAD-binding oxidoreductase [Acidobacteriota bacterium]
MPDSVVTNWFGNVTSHPHVIADANSVDDIVAILKDPGKYPSPVRAVGSNHSTTECGVAEGGTLVRMKMNRVLQVGADTVTVEAGAVYIDIADELRKHRLQFHVNTEIGNLSAASAACAGTKDASFPGEYGQVGSYVIGVRMVLPSGDLLQVTEDQPELMQKVRASYGTFGIIYEVTFRVRPLTPMAVHHKTFDLKDFIATLPELKKLDYAMMFYVFPFDGKITVEFRRYNPGATGEPNRQVWQLRNYFWSKVAPKLAHDTEQNVSVPALRYGLIDNYNAISRFNLENLVQSENTLAPDQTIRYPQPSDESRYTFSLFAFPEEIYPDVLTAYFQFNKDYYRQKGYRSNMLSVGYRIAQDRQSLFSYSYDGPVMTVDPVSTANSGWDAFLVAYNQFCSDRGGVPLPNQTPHLTRPILLKAFGDKVKTLEESRRQYDPQGRLLNAYFRDLFGSAT